MSHPFEETEGHLVTLRHQKRSHLRAHVVEKHHPFQYIPQLDFPDLRRERGSGTVQIFV